MNKLLSFILLIALFSCNDSDNLIKAAPSRTYQIPDSTHQSTNGFAYHYYLKKKEILKQLNTIRPLENDSSRTDIRLWELTAYVNHQKIYLLKKRDNIWTVSVLNYYINLLNPDKVDSISMEIIYQKQVSAEHLQALDIEKIWGLPLQGKVTNDKNLSSRGTAVILIEMSDKKKYKFLAYSNPLVQTEKDENLKIVDSFLNKVKALYD